MKIHRDDCASPERRRSPALRHLLLLLVGVLPVGMLPSCAVVKNPTPISSLRPDQLEIPPEYRISAGDELEIAFFHTPELNTSVIVRPDGKIGLPLAQGVQAAGRTPEELAARLRTLYGVELIDPDVAVIVRSFTAYQIHVGGEVNEPGMFPLVGRITVLQAIFQAGGALNRARMNEILLVRRDPEGGHLVIPIDLESAVDGSDPSQDLALLPYDTVLVPPSNVAQLNTWVQLYIRENLPVDFGVRPSDL